MMNRKLNSDNINEIIHDLKTPITSIIGFIELLQKGSHEEKTQQEFYGIISSEAERLLRMVNDILYTSKNQSNGQHDEKCNISIQIHKYVKELAPLAKKRDIDIDINVNTSNIYISIPENKIARILTNIIENAIKYNKESGKVFIGVTEKNNWVQICVKDTGIGIPSEELSEIFKRYYRSDSSRKLGVKGSGLGLAIAKDIAESYSGTIKVTSNVGQSTEFLISFPAAKF